MTAEAARETDRNPSDERERTPLERFEDATALPMLVLALAIIPLLVLPLIFDLSQGVKNTFVAIEWIIWAAFAVEYIVRFYLAPKKWFFFTHNLVDLAIVLLPFLRPLRVARSARVLRVLRAARAVAFLLRGMTTARAILTRHKLHYALLVSLGVVVAGALLVESFERDAPDGNIGSIPDALWWAVTTITTVGYGDRFPTTAAGRGVGVVLMIVGIALFGFLAGTLASFLLENEVEEAAEEANDPKLEEINARLERIERILERERDPV